jgi:hypothetical protein
LLLLGGQSEIHERPKAPNRGGAIVTRHSPERKQRGADNGATSRASGRGFPHGLPPRRHDSRIIFGQPNFGNLVTR